MKNVYLLGATGSIGIQTLDVIREHNDLFTLVSIAFGSNLKKGFEIIEEFKPKFVSVKTKEDALLIQKKYPYVKVNYGLDGLIEAATYEGTPQNENIVVTAVVGSVGLTPTIAAIKKGYDIALANKETLVTAGHIVMDLAKKHRVNILPVDSEHSAIFQCLTGEDPNKINKLIITASGGSFRHKTRDDLQHVTLDEALNHPNWSMGHKITIDSATMMNKGFEVIEAHYLFGLPYEKIETILHKESVIHSMVEFIDTSIIAQLGTPDMRIPIQYALNYPERIVSNTNKRLKLYDIGTLHFNEMDFTRFPMLQYAYDAGKNGGSMPCVLNTSNDVAVSLFIKGKITFLEIEKIVYDALAHHKVIYNPDLDTILSLEKELKSQIISTYLKGE